MTPQNRTLEAQRETSREKGDPAGDESPEKAFTKGRRFADRGSCSEAATVKAATLKRGGSPVGGTTEMAYSRGSGVWSERSMGGGVVVSVVHAGAGGGRERSEG